jgi:hypothetical protein
VATITATAVLVEDTDDLLALASVARSNAELASSRTGTAALVDDDWQALTGTIRSLGQVGYGSIPVVGTVFSSSVIGSRGLRRN